MAIILPAPPPDASATLRGVVNTSAQTFAGTLTGAAVTGDTAAGGYVFGITASCVTSGSTPWCCLGQTSFWATAEPTPFAP